MPVPLWAHHAFLRRYRTGCHGPRVPGLAMTDYTPDDRDAARPEDLARIQARRPSATPTAHVWPEEDPSAGAFHYIGQALTPAEFQQYCLDYDFGSAPPSFWIWHHTVNPDATWAPLNSDPAIKWDRNEAGMS